MPADVWDVVNEAIDWTAGRGFHVRENSVWAAVPNYIHKAFKAARRADPNALLFYNDFRFEVNEGKLNYLVEMIKEMQEKNVPIDGVGIQFHVGPNSRWNEWNNGGWPITRETTAKVIRTIGNLGLQVHITEIDVDLCSNPPCDVNDEELLDAQAKMYQDAFAACYYDNPDFCTAFISWGFYDPHSWLHDTSYPLYFNDA